MKFAILLAVLISGFIGATAMAEETNGVIQFDSEKVAAAFAKGGIMLQTNNFKVMAGRRVAPGEVEIHEKDTDVFYITEGSATFVTGGTAADQHTTAPGEIRAPKIAGGEEHHLKKGDVIVIPAGVPHQFTAVDGTFLYFVVKVSK
ncbi:MAG TPA: cupin domain-containing protein [Candidatus Polarisedimenticolia bacterium]|nr:cupin domain-containing protein [Candidatus Polarisedimenticolia bacterium]